MGVIKRVDCIYFFEAQWLSDRLEIEVLLTHDSLPAAKKLAMLMQLLHFLSDAFIIFGKVIYQAKMVCHMQNDCCPLFTARVISHEIILKAKPCDLNYFYIL